MPRRKAAEVQILPPEDQSTRGRKKLVEAEHTIKYSAPVPVTVGEDEVEESDLVLDDDTVDIEKKRKRKTAKTEREELRKKLMNHGVTAASTLKLIIERYVHSDGPDSGTTAEKSHCTKYGCDEAHVLNQDYMDVAAKWGAGRYWFTLYKDGTIVSQWEKRLEPSRPLIQSVNPADPTSPPFIIQTTNDGQQVGAVPTLKDFMKGQREALKEQLEMAKLIREAYGMQPDTTAQPARSEEEVLTSAIINRPEVLDNVVGSVMKRFGGKGSADDEPWYADVVRDAVKSGQAAGIVKTAIDSLFFGFRGLFPGGQTNGQAPIATAPLQEQTGVHAPQPNQTVYQDGKGQIPQAITQGSPGSTQDGTNAQQPSSPEDPYTQMLTIVITALTANSPVDDVVKRVNGFLLFNPAYIQVINDQFSPDAEQLLGAITTIPGCEQIAQAEHAKQWIEEFQAKFFEESQEGGEE